MADTYYFLTALQLSEFIINPDVLKHCSKFDSFNELTAFYGRLEVGMINFRVNVYWFAVPCYNKDTGEFYYVVTQRESVPQERLNP